MLGVLARSARLHDVGVCDFVFLSNHYDLLLRPRDAPELARFMNHLDSNLAREAGRLHRWRERFWARRYRPVPISFEPEAQLARLEYLLAQGCKEGLVAKPQDWPGATSVHARLDGSEIQGVWYDRTAEYWARKRREEVEPGQFTSVETLRLAQLPCWEELDPEDARKRTAEIVARIAAEIRRQHRQALWRGREYPAAADAHPVRWRSEGGKKVIWIAILPVGGLAARPRERRPQPGDRRRIHMGSEGALACLPAAARCLPKRRVPPRSPGFQGTASPVLEPRMALPVMHRPAGASRRQKGRVPWPSARRVLRPGKAGARRRRRSFSHKENPHE